MNLPASARKLLLLCLFFPDVRERPGEAEEDDEASKDRAVVFLADDEEFRSVSSDTPDGL
jgi:hypothetical protein